MKPVFFESQAAFRKWLKENGTKVQELSIGFWKKDSGKGGLTYKEAVDEALCFGWIDGVRRSFGADAYTMRFTPRKAKSNWSAINVARVAELEKAGRMTAAGRAAFERRDPGKGSSYSYETQRAKFTPAFQKALEGNAKAWQYWQAQRPSYQRVATFWVMSAKKEETRQARMKALIEDSAAGRFIKPQRYGTSKTG